MSRTEAGRVFQIRGPAMPNDRSPIAVRDLGTSAGPRWQSACRSDADQCTVGRWTGSLHWSTAVQTFVDYGGDLERNTLANWQAGSGVTATPAQTAQK